MAIRRVSRTNAYHPPTHPIPAVLYCPESRTLAGTHTSKAHDVRHSGSLCASTLLDRVDLAKESCISSHLSSDSSPGEGVSTVSSVLLFHTDCHSHSQNRSSGTLHQSRFCLFRDLQFLVTNTGMSWSSLAGPTALLNASYQPPTPSPQRLLSPANRWRPPCGSRSQNRSDMA